MTQHHNFIDVFAGCGGLSLGLSQAGFQGIFAVEHNGGAFETFQANFLQAESKFKFQWPAWLPDAAIGIEELLTGYEGRLLALRGKVDLLAGGPPCQGFSAAGRRKAEDPRNQLFLSYLRLVGLLQPKAVLIENVKGFTVDFKGRDSQHNYSAELVRALSEHYTVSESLLNLTQFGVPQNRVRYFVIAFRRGIAADEPFELLRDLLPGVLRNLELRVPVTSMEAISDFEVSRCGVRESRDTSGFKEIAHIKPLTKYQKIMAEGTKESSDLRLANHTPKVARRFAEIIGLCHAEGRLNRSISEEIRQLYGLKKRAIRVLDPDRPSPTITSMPDDLLHYKEPRILTVRENARLQSFPDWFTFKGSYTTGGDRRRRQVPRYTQVANAVPPLAAYALGLVIKQLLDVQPQNSGLPRRANELIPELAELCPES